MRIVDSTHCVTIIPEMAVEYIPAEHRCQVKTLAKGATSRKIAVAVRRTYVKSSIIKALIDTMIISQKEATMYGVPIQVYFFSRNKVWKEYERIQSDIFDHLLAMVPKFDLKVYQYSD